MKEFLKIVFCGIIFSSYYFPFEFTFLPGVNTKMILAVIGTLLFVKNCSLEKRVTINKDFLYISILAGLFSLASLFSVTYNNTTDYTYATYIVKMCVWWSGAYSVLYLIREIHGKLSLQLVLSYMACICATQALLAIFIDNISALQNLVDNFILQDTEFLHRTKRLYGIGAAFDTAGIRFSCALLGLGYLIKEEQNTTNKIYFWILFFTIVIAGNMMSRTTTIGTMATLFYLAFAGFTLQREISIRKIKFICYFLIITGILGWFTYYNYEHNPTFRNYFQYGFEGFFNWYENAEWSTGSTTRLQDMFVWPDNIKTWFIGDGWFVNPFDPNAFYKYTDVGYLRFIYYCGIIGLSLFSIFFIFSTSLLCKKWKDKKFFLLLLLLLEFIFWIKISTDIFVVFALLLLLDKEEKETLNKENYQISNI